MGTKEKQRHCPGRSQCILVCKSASSPHFWNLNCSLDYSTNPPQNGLITISSTCFRCCESSTRFPLNGVLPFTSIMLPTMPVSHISLPSLTSKHTVSAMDLLLSLIPSSGSFLHSTSDRSFALPNILKEITAFICFSWTVQQRENIKLKGKSSQNLSLLASIASKSWILISNSTTNPLAHYQYSVTPQCLQFVMNPQSKSFTKLYDLIMKVLKHSEAWNPSTENETLYVYIYLTRSMWRACIAGSKDGTAQEPPESLNPKDRALLAQNWGKQLQVLPISHSGRRETCWGHRAEITGVWRCISVG